MFAYRNFMDDYRQVTFVDLLDLGVPARTLRDLVDEFDPDPVTDDTLDFDDALFTYAD